MDILRSTRTVDESLVARGLTGKMSDRQKTSFMPVSIYLT